MRRGIAESKMQSDQKEDAWGLCKVMSLEQTEGELVISPALHFPSRLINSAVLEELLR